MSSLVLTSLWKIPVIRKRNKLQNHSGDILLISQLSHVFTNQIFILEGRARENEKN